MYFPFFGLRGSNHAHIPSVPQITLIHVHIVTSHRNQYYRHRTRDYTKLLRNQAIISCQEAVEKADRMTKKKAAVTIIGTYRIKSCGNDTCSSWMGMTFAEDKRKKEDVVKHTPRLALKGTDVTPASGFHDRGFIVYTLYPPSRIRCASRDPDQGVKAKTKITIVG